MYMYAKHENVGKTILKNPRNVAAERGWNAS